VASALLTAGSALALALMPAAAVHAAPQASRQVVIIAVPDLRWSDLASMPSLAAYARTSSVGDLSVRGEPIASRCADGSLTFAAGNRADAGDATGCTVGMAQLTELRTELHKDRYGADIAALGNALDRGGVTTAAVGPSAELLLANSSGQVGMAAATVPAALGKAEVVAVLDDGLYVAQSAGRTAAAQALDRLLAVQLAAVPAGATTIVAGTSDAKTGGPHLHVVLIHGPGWRHVELTSSSTHARFVQLIDLAPTVLAAEHLPAPTSMIGRPARDSRWAAPSAGDFVSADRHDLDARRLDGTVRTWFGIAAIAVLGLLVLAWWRHSGRWHAAAVWVGRLAVGLPLATYLLQLVPWWHPSLGWYPPMLAAVLVALAGATTLATRRSMGLGLIVVPALTAATLIVDQLAGAPLQASAPLGNLAIVAGRFHGMGNIAFACLGAATLICAGVAAGVLRDRTHRRTALLVAGAICVVACVVDAAPPFGDDFGGILSLPVSVALLIALLAQMRFTAKRVALTVFGVAVLAVGLAAADYARPAADRTQIGTFAGEVLHGGAGRTISRKAYSSLHSFGNVAVTGSVVLVLLIAVVYRQQVGAILRRVPGLREAAIALALLAVVGTASNDSGVVIAEFVVVIGLLSVVGAGVADPSGFASSGPPLPPPASDLRPTQRGKPFAT
jgi:hypothetical protein